MSLASKATSVPVVTAPRKSVIADAYASSSTAAIAVVYIPTSHVFVVPESKSSLNSLIDVTLALVGIGAKVYENAGESTDPGGYYYVAATFNATGGTAGDMSFIIEYVIN